MGTDVAVLATSVSGTVGVGDLCLPNLTTGTSNIAVGKDSGKVVSSGSNNVFLVVCVRMRLVRLKVLRRN
jgi:hypothetical protein